MTDLTRNLLISLASHMAYMQGQLQARHDPDEDDLEDCYWYAESVALRQMVSDALAGEPAAVTGQPRPTEDDVEDAAQCIYEAMRFERVETTPAWSELGNSLAQDTARKAARAVLAHWGNPAPAPPADGEVAEVMGLFRHWAEAYPDSVTVDPYWLTRAADLLQRLIPPQPQPVSERPPGPKDCDAIGCCWWYSASHGWELYHRENGLGTSTHWLPAHALPLPEVGE